MKTLLLIDANSLVHRCFHALPPFTTSTGEPSGALYGLSNILLRILREERLDYAAALFDRPEPTFRREIYPQYKAQRPKAADELVRQIIAARELFQKFGVKVLEKPGAEADDLIASLARKFGKEPNLKIIILTSDLDTLQLIRDEKVTVRALKKGISETMLYDERAVKERYGLKPEQMIDYKVLVGDSSDNIKGVPGIGPKTAAKILQSFGNLDNFYESRGREMQFKEKIKDFWPQIEISRKLIKLDADVGLNLKELNDLEIKEDLPELENYFKKMGFKTILERLTKEKSLQGQIFPAQE